MSYEYTEHMQNKLMDIYDKQYDDNFSRIINKGIDREKAKDLMGLIFQKTKEALTKKDTTKQSVEGAFNKVRMQFGIC
jgi:hypothetical protein